MFTEDLSAAITGSLFMGGNGSLLVSVQDLRIRRTKIRKKSQRFAEEVRRR
jgi:hypothetical protein